VTDAKSTPVLTLYIAAHCIGCERALQLAAHAADEFAGQRVAIVDLGEPGADPPAGVFGTPTWMVGARVLFRGNPSLDELRNVLDSLAQ
jgi:2-hydroxychromene-2-carboxylate isomerase